MKHTQHAAYFYIKIMYNFESYNDGRNETRCFELEMGSWLAGCTSFLVEILLNEAQKKLFNHSEKTKLLLL